MTYATPFKDDLESLSFFEFWPAWLFYAPLKVYIAWLALRYGGLTLPTIVDPLFDVGGLVGESKSQILRQIPASHKHLAAELAVFRRHSAGDEDRDFTAAKAAMEQAGITYPVVAKPDIGCRGMGVQRVHNDDALKAYIASFPVHEDIILQKLYDFPNEVGLFYIRYPDQANGFIFSMTRKLFAHVTGDGKSTLKELIENHPRAGKIAHIYLPRHKDRLDLVVPAGEPYRIAFAGSHSRGTIFKDGDWMVTPRMTATWDAIGKAIPEFYFGRFDVRFNTLDDLEKGENIKIVEINGAGSEATHVWDAKTSLWKAYKDMAAQYRHLFAIGAANKKRGFKPLSWKQVSVHIKKHEYLTTVYPGTD